MSSSCAVGLSNHPKDPDQRDSFQPCFQNRSYHPSEDRTPLFRVKESSEDANSEQLQVNLDLLEEHRECTVMRMASYRQSMARYYNANIKAKEFKVGDLVLQQVDVSQPIEQGKLSPNQEGSYQVDEMVHPSTYLWKHFDVTPLPRSWNSSNLFMYYQ